MDWSLEGQTVVVTGSTSGIGKETARGLVRTGARVVLVSRNPSRLDATAEELRRERAGANVEVVCGDLSSMDSTLGAAAELRRRFPSVRVLINNAGAYYSLRELTADGFERTFALNYLGAFLLTRQLLPALRAGAPSRVITLSSLGHYPTRLDFEDLQLARKYTGLRAYGRSKLANVLFTFELARRLEGSGVTANCLHPGLVASNFGSGQGTFGRLFRLAIALRVFVPPAQGARGCLLLATQPELQGVTGRYFSGLKPVQPGPFARKPAFAAQLWETTEKMLAPWLQAYHPPGT